MAAAESNELQLCDLSHKVKINMSELTQGRGPLSLEMKSTERGIIMDAIVRNGGNKSIAARELGIERRTLYYKMKELEIPVNFFDN